jgi:cytochrome b
MATPPNLDGSLGLEPLLQASTSRTERALVWDLPVRMMHWILALAVAGAWATQKIPGSSFKYHVWCGYTVLIVVVTRLLWGLVGTRHARFSSFVRGPAAIGRYARALIAGAEVAVAGHNPLGALMVLLLLAMLLAQALTGLFANDQILNTGPLFGYVSLAKSDQLSSVHARLSNFILAAIVVHVGAAFFYLAIKRDNLISPLVTGYKSLGSVPPEDIIRSSRTWLALTIAAVVGLILALVVRAAPQASLSVY